MVQLWMVVVGFAIVLHAGTLAMAEKRAALEAGLSADESGMGMQVVLEVMIGSMLALWGGIGEFKPIRVGDEKKPRWETLHQRSEFHSYRSRAKFLRPLLTNLPTPPES
mmetsp:Transcript_89779/g.159624  ORF Transcript_89779/g.159624 Transcript_89779/m.159624 type:complete len:109 (+) Transcript_89779:81-407(+)